MAGDGGLRLGPRVRDTWWVFGLAASALGLFLVAFLVDLHCGRRGCRGSLPFRLFDLDTVGGVPRLFTAGLFVGVAFLAWRARRAAAGASATWWAAVVVIATFLALAKLIGLHSTLKDDSPGSTLVGGLALAAVTLTALWVAGRRWGPAVAGPVVLALAGYVAVALGLDVLTGLAAGVQHRVGWPTVAGATFVEELGEALAALLLVTVCRSAAPRAGEPPSSDAAQVSGADSPGGRQAFWRAR